MAKTVVAQPTPTQVGALDPPTLGRFVRARRTQLGLGIHEAAALCGVSVKLLGKLERAQGDVHLSKVLLVCRMLGVSLKVENWDQKPSVSPPA